MKTSKYLRHVHDTFNELREVIDAHAREEEKKSILLLNKVAMVCRISMAVSIFLALILSVISIHFINQLVALIREGSLNSEKTLRIIEQIKAMSETTHSGV